MSTLFPLTVRDAVSKRSGVALIGPIELDLTGAGITVVIGPNGSGKTTLLRMLHGAARLNHGSIRWACDQDHARDAQTFVFQRPIMLRRSILENLVYPLRTRGVSKARAYEQAEHWAERLGLGRFLSRQAPSLSGGEQQKLALARALITEPALVFLDEPCASLDARTMKAIESILIEARANGTQIIMSTHDMGQAKRLANDVVFLLNGKVHEHTCALDFFSTPTTQEAIAFLNGDIVE